MVDLKQPVYSADKGACFYRQKVANSQGVMVPVMVFAMATVAVSVG